MPSSPAIPRLLVVENDPGLSDLLTALLTEEGYGLVCASSLPQALALTETQVFHGIFTTLFPQDQKDPLRSVEPLRVLTTPTPIVVLSRYFVEEAEARRRGYASVLEFPFRIEDVLQVLATRINRPFSPAQAQHAQLITEFLAALGQGEWEMVRRLCLPTVQYVPLTTSRLTPIPLLEGIDASLAYAQAARAQLPGFRLDHCVVFEQRGQLVTRFGCSWQGRDGQQLSLVGSVVFRFAGERIAHIGVALPRHRLRALLANAGVG
jgi:CheY-like chemotaxis protein